MMSHLEFTAKTDKSFLIYEKTYYGYIKEAVYFLKEAGLYNEIENETIKNIYNNINQIVILLKSCSEYKTSNAWRKLRRSLVVYFKALKIDEASLIIEDVKNPTDIKDRPVKPGRKKRLSSVKDKQFQSIYNYLQNKNDEETCALLNVARLTGARPCELNKITIKNVDEETNEITIFIKGAKKTRKGTENLITQRGIDRTIKLELDIEDMFEFPFNIKECQKLTDRQIKNAQERLRKAVNKVFKSVKKMCFYSLRYTMGSNLKHNYNGNKNKDIIIAAVMGHRCTSSQSYYGHINSGTSKKMPKPSLETVKQVIRDNKRNPFAKKTDHSPTYSR